MLSNILHIFEEGFFSLFCQACAKKETSIWLPTRVLPDTEKEEKKPICGEEGRRKAQSGDDKKRSFAIQCGPPPFSFIFSK